MQDQRMNVIFDQDKKRRQKFFVFIIWASVPVFLFFGLSDLLKGNFSEGLMDIIASIILCTIGFVFPKVKGEWFYRIMSAFIIMTIFYDLAVNIGNEFTWFWFLPIPVAIYFLLGKKEGLYWLIAIFIFFLNFLYLPISPYFLEYNPGNKLRFLISWLLVSGIAYVLEASREKYFYNFIKEHKQLLAEKENLQDALANIKVLNGLLPICANCKKVRDDSGYWNQIEYYIEKHSEADFSHSICPDCARELYPEIDTLTGKTDKE